MMRALCTALAASLAFGLAAAAADHSQADLTTDLPHITPFKKRYLKRFNGTISVLAVFYHPDLPVSDAYLGFQTKRTQN